MRWPFRRRGGDAPAPSSTPDTTSVSASAPGPAAAVVRPSGRQWVTLPPLPVTVSSSAPLVSGPAPVVPALPGHRRVSAPAVPPPMGRVDGLVSVVPQTFEEPTQSVAPEPRRQLVHRRVRSGPPAAEGPAMVEATGPYVGEAREPATPYRAPGWLRYVPEWLNQNTQSDPEPAAPAPRPKAVLPPSRIMEGPSTAPSTGELPHRRAPRRLGLGAPLSHPEGAGEPEPAPPPPAPPPVHPSPVDPAPVSSTPTAPVPQPTAVPLTYRAVPGEPRPRAAAPEARPWRPRTGYVPADFLADRAPAGPVTGSGPELVHGPAGGGPAGPVAATGAPELVPGPVAAGIGGSAPGDPGQAPSPPTGGVEPAPGSATDTGSPTDRGGRGSGPTGGGGSAAGPTASGSRAARPEAGRVELVGLPRRPAVGRAPTGAKPIAGHVPVSLASAVRGPHHVDVSSIPVHRGPEVSSEARTLNARAFTRGGEVFLPAEAGPIEGPVARGLLAHELVHAVQQRTLGPTLPAAHTPEGIALEAEAVAAEREHGHDLVHPSLTQVIGQAARTVGVQLAPMPAPVLPSTPVAPPPEPVLAAPVRDEIDLIAESSAMRTLEEWTAPTPDEEEKPVTEEPDIFALPDFTDPTPAPVAEPVLGRAQQDVAMAEQILQVINIEREQSGDPALTTLDANAMDLIRRTIAEQADDTAARSVIFAQAAAASGVQAELEAARPPQQPAERPVETVMAPPVPMVAPPPPAPTASPTDPGDHPIEIERLDLEQLTARLYDRLRSRIRLELLIDRERAGLLTDFR